MNVILEGAILKVIVVAVHADQQYPSVLVKPVVIHLPAKGKLGIAVDYRAHAIQRMATPQTISPNRLNSSISPKLDPKKLYSAFRRASLSLVNIGAISPAR